MAPYRKINIRIWDDTKFRSLCPDGQRLWFYLLTGPDTNRIGLYGFSMAKAAEYLAVETPSVRRLIADIDRLGMALYDEESRLLWIPKWLNYNEPAGYNQIVSLFEEVEEYGAHPFAKCLTLFLHARKSTSGQDKAPITKKQALLIRDECQCRYCHIDLTWDTYEMDHVISKTKASGDRYEQLVAACRACNRRKDNKSAEEFGHPFVRGSEYSLGEAVTELIYNEDLRHKFSHACGGLPQVFDDIEEVAHIIRRVNGDRTASKRRRNGETKRSPQEQEQEQDIEQEKEQEEDRELRLVENASEKNVEVNGTYTLAADVSRLTPEAFVALYNAETPESHPKVKTLTPARLAKTKAYLAIFPDRSWWQTVFEHIRGSPFLRGEKITDGHHSFRADFDWLLTKGKDGTENCVKVAEGRYDETPAEAAYARLGAKGYRTALASQRILEENNHDITGREPLLPVPESARRLLH